MPTVVNRRRNPTASDRGSLVIVLKEDEAPRSGGYDLINFGIRPAAKVTAKSCSALS